MENGILDILYQVLASPSTALEDIGKRKCLGWSIIAAVFASVVLSFILLPNPPELAEGILNMDKGSFNRALAIFLCVIIFLIALFTEGVIFHLIAVLLGGRGDYLGIVCGLCFACFPLVFFTPLMLLRASLGSGGIILYHIGSLFLFLWALALGIIAIRQNYHFSLARAITTYLIPNILLVVVPLLVITLIVAL